VGPVAEGLARRPLALVALLYAAGATGLQAQQPLTRRVIDSLLQATPVIPDDSILSVARRHCLAFVPTRRTLAEFRRLRPLLIHTFEAQLVGTCLGGALQVSTEDLQALIERGDSGDVFTYVTACPSGEAPRQVVSVVARTQAPWALLKHIAEVCKVELSRRRGGAGLEFAYSPLYAASQIRSQNMDFVGGPEVTLVIAWPIGRAARLSGEFGVGSYDLDQSGVDVRASGHFHLYAPAVALRLLPTCAIRKARCGDHLLSDDDLYVNVALSYNSLHGDTRFSVKGTGGSTTETSAAFTFTGVGLGIGVGYSRRLSRAWGLEVEAQYTWIGFQNVTMETNAATLEEKTGGVSAKRTLRASLVLNP